MKRRLAVVLFNLGGPDGPAAVRPFLRNLFADPAIIGLPAPLRLPLAELISRTREKSAQANYAIMGGRSPLLPETQAQGRALEAALNAGPTDTEARVFIAMRYWKPETDETARAVGAFDPDELVLLPLYPQFSTTTTGSSAAAWAKAWKGRARPRTVCCYPTLGGLAEAHGRKIVGAWEAAGRPSPVRLLFSAHGLPEKVIAAGDPYQAQVEATAAAVAARLPNDFADWRVCYQSRVGPMKWIGPSTPEALAAAAAEGLGVVVVPIAFVSEHVETLVELDHEYAALARDLGLPAYVRTPAVGVEAAFIEGLAEIAATALGRDGVQTACGGRWCPPEFSRCPAEARP